MDTVIVCIYNDNVGRELVRMSHNNACVLATLSLTYNRACEQDTQSTLSNFVTWLVNTELATRVERIIPDHYYRYIGKGHKMDLTQTIIVRINNSIHGTEHALLRMRYLDYIRLPTHRQNYKEHRQHRPNKFNNFVAWLVSTDIAEHVIPEKYYAFE